MLFCNTESYSGLIQVRWEMLWAAVSSQVIWLWLSGSEMVDSEIRAKGLLRPLCCIDPAGEGQMSDLPGEQFPGNSVQSHSPDAGCKVQEHEECVCGGCSVFPKGLP